MYYLDADAANQRGMQLALALATALHLALILGLAFETGGPADYAPQIAVTLATRPSHQAPEETRHIAQSNQMASGTLADFNDLRSHRAMPPIPRGGARQPGAGRAPARPMDSALTSRSPAPRSAPPEPEPEEEPAEGPGQDSASDPLSRELADLEARLDEQSQAYSELPRVRRLTSLSARQAVDAAYLQGWRQRVETVGNKYYPEASVRYGIYGSLRLLVVIRQDGSLEDIRVLATSGYAVLDEAAIKIVRMAAPFDPFPAELRATADKLEIIRTWQFQENRLSSG